MQKISTVLIFATIIALLPVKVLAVTLTFDELPYQSVDDLSFRRVTFDFKVDGSDSTDAYYNSSGPGTTRYVEDPSLAGVDYGILTLSFDIPIYMLEFGVALRAMWDIKPGFSVELFDTSLSSIGTFDVDTLLVSNFSDGLFVYRGDPVIRAVIDFNEDYTHEEGGFALDNLTFTPVSEPSTVLLVCSGLIGLLGFRKKFS